MVLPFLAPIPAVPCLCAPSPLLFQLPPSVQIFGLIIFCLIQEAIFVPMLGLFIQSLLLKQIANCASVPTDLGQQGNDIGLSPQRDAHWGDVAVMPLLLELRKEEYFGLENPKGWWAKVQG